MITQDVATTQGTPQRGRQLSRWRLAVVGAVVALAAGIGLVLGFTLVADRPSALGSASSYLPADTVMYGEARLDLTSGQAASLHAILQRFPAADADLLPLKALADAVDQGLSQTGSGLTWAHDIGPWFDGRVSFAMLDYPVGSTNAKTMQLPKMAALLGVKDVTAATAFTDKLRSLATQQGATTLSSSQHAGVTIWSAEGSTQLSGSPGFAYAVTADELLLATGSATIESMLDAHNGSQSLGGQQELQQLISRLPSDRVGFFAIDTRQMVEQLRSQVEQQDPSLASLLDQYIANIPPFAVSSLSLQPDALAFDGASTLPGGDLAPANSRRDLATRVPAGTLFFADGGKLGDVLARFVTGAKAALAAQSDGQASAQLKQVEAAMGANLEDFVSWIGDGALAVGATDGTPWGGLVLEAADVDAATQRLNQLRSLIQLGAQQSGEQVHVTTATVAGVEVTTITAKQGSGDMVVTEPVSVQYAMKDGTVLIGFGDQFVGRSLGLAAGDSLADSNRFKQAVSRFGGDDNAGLAFMDLAGIRQAVEQVGGQMLPPEYNAQIKPNVEPLDYLVYLTRVEGNVVVTHGGLVLH